MSRKRKPAGPSPAVGDYVLIGYAGSLDPHFWWISEVAWTDGDTMLVFDGTGHHPTRAPHLSRVIDAVAFGSKDHCLNVMVACNRVAREHDAELRDANVALESARNTAREAILAALSAAASADPATRAAAEDARAGSAG